MATNNPQQKRRVNTKPKAKITQEVVSVVSLYEIRTELALLKQKLDQLINSDLRHIEADVGLLKKWGLGFFMAILISVLSLHLEKILL